MLVKFGPGIVSRGRSTAVVVARQCGRRIVSPHRLSHPFIISAASFSDGCGSSSGSSSSSGGKAKLKIKKQEVMGHAGAASGATCFGDDESDDEDKKKNRQGGKRHRKKDEHGDDDDDDFAHKLSDDESHTQREEMNKAAQEKAMFVTKAGAVANVSLAISKGAVGFAISSTGLIADAANSLGDVLCDGVVYYAIQEARKTATPDRPWGRGKVESLGALSVGALLLTTGVGIGYSAIHAGAEILNLNLANPLQHLDIPLLKDVFQASIATDPTATLPVSDPAAASPAHDSDLGTAALAVSGLSIAAKEILFRYTLKVGEAANSSAVIANAWQHRADAVASSAVFAGLVGSMLGYPILDPVAGVMVAGLICKQAFKIGNEALRDLSDAPAEAQETEQLRQTCLQVKGVLNVEELLARKSGPFLFVEATIGVDGSISASAAHRIAELTRLELIREHTGRVANAVVHVTPLGSSGLGEQYPAWARDHDFIVAEIKRAVLPIKEIHAVSEVQVYYKDNGLISTKVDILLPPNLTIHQAHAIAVQARKAIEQVLPGIGDVDVDLELDEA